MRSIAQIKGFSMGQPIRKLNDVYASAKEQNKKQLCRFMRDMKRAGHRQRFIEDSASWSGPNILRRHPHCVVGYVPCLSRAAGKTVPSPSAGPVTGRQWWSRRRDLEGRRSGRIPPARSSQDGEKLYNFRAD
jgi:hypothetical protein